MSNSKWMDTKLFIYMCTYIYTHTHIHIYISSKSSTSPSRVWLFATPWTVDCQAPLSIGFSRQEYWSGPAPSILYLTLNLDWQFVSYMILYMFQCHSLKSSHPLGFRIWNTCTLMVDSCWCMAKPIHYFKAISLQLK